MSQAIIDRANKLRDSGRTKEAIAMLKPLLKSKDAKVVINAYDASAVAYMNEELFDKAFFYYGKALEIAAENGWGERLGGILRNTAIAYKDAKKYAQAEKYFLQSIECINKYSESRPNGTNANKQKAGSLGITYSKLALNYTKEKSFIKAKRAFFKAGLLLKASEHEYWRLIGAIDYCEFLLATKKYKEARVKLQSLMISSIAQNKSYKAMEILSLWRRASEEMGDRDESKNIKTFATRLLRTFDSPLVVKKFKDKLEK